MKERYVHSKGFNLCAELQARKWLNIEIFLPMSIFIRASMRMHTRSMCACVCVRVCVPSSCVCIGVCVYVLIRNSAKRRANYSSVRRRKYQDFKLYTAYREVCVCVCVCVCMCVYVCMFLSETAQRGVQNIQVSVDVSTRILHYILPTVRCVCVCVCIYIYIYIYIWPIFWPCVPMRARASSFTRFLDHTQRRTTFGRTPLDEWSVRHRELYVKTHNTHKRQTSMTTAEFEPTISAGERSQTHALDRAATGIGTHTHIYIYIYILQELYS